MQTINTFFSKIEQENISNISLVGMMYIEDGIAEFLPWMYYVFFEFNTQIIKFELIEASLKLKIKYVNSLTYDFEVEEDMHPAKSSISHLILISTLADNVVKSIEIYGDEWIDGELICDAICFNLSSGQELFLDPISYFGMNIGSKKQKNFWLNDFPNTDSYTVPKSIIELTVP